MSLPQDLRTSPALVLARAERDLPRAGGGTGQWFYEPKWDGFRVSVVVAGERVRVWSRHGKDLSSSFPDLREAVQAQVPAGTVLDGEAVLWVEGALSFAELQRRLGGSARRVRDLAREHPASLVCFDVLAARDEDLRGQPLEAWRRVLEGLCAWSPPLHVSPATTDVDEAVDWFDTMRAAGIEGVVAKRSDATYRGGRRQWVKVKQRDTTEVVVGAVTGSLERPGSFVAGRFDGDVLRIVGRSVALTTAQQRVLAPALREAGEDHPWPERLRGRFDRSGDVPVVRVVPDVVAEVLADAAVDRGVFRHGLRFVRLRPDMGVDDVVDFGSV